MRISNIGIVKAVGATALAAALTACGGGGGSSGTVSAEYQISLRADKTALPVNIANVQAGQGVYRPFTTTLYVQATKNGQPIPGGENIFTCNVAGGLNSGALYYLDGDSAHEKEIDDGNGGKITVPLAYRSITLGSNSGGASFHFHAGNQTGTATISCSVNDPRDSTSKSASVNIVVGAATGKAASIQVVAQYPTLGIQGNTANLRTSTAIEAHVLDDANQSVPSSSNANVQVTIASSSASDGASLLAGGVPSSSVRVNTINGVGLFSVSSGAAEGTILLEVTADRFDGDITNGIQQPIKQLYAVQTTKSNPSDAVTQPLTVVDKAPPDGTNGVAYGYALSAMGGVAPYTWVSLGGLPDGLSLSSAGILSGTPAVKLPGTFNSSIRVMDSKGSTVTANFAIKIGTTPVSDPMNAALAINLAGCGSDINSACSIPVANPVSPAPVPAPQFFYQNALTVSGPGVGDATWGLVQAPSWLNLTNPGILSIDWTAAITPPSLKDCTSGAFFLTAARGGSTTMRKVQLVFGSGAGTCIP